MPEKETIKDNLLDAVLAPDRIENNAAIYYTHTHEYRFPLEFVNILKQILAEHMKREKFETMWIRIKKLSKE